MVRWHYSLMLWRLCTFLEARPPSYDNMVDVRHREAAYVSDEGSLLDGTAWYTTNQTLNFPNPSHRSAHVYMVAPKVAHIDDARNILRLIIYVRST